MFCLALQLVSHYTFPYKNLFFLSRGLNSKINSLHERCIRIVSIVYSDNRSNCEDLLGKDKSVLIDVKNVQTLALEVFEVAKDLSAQIASEIFEKRNNVYHLRNPSEFALLKIYNLLHDIVSISYLAPQIWNVVPLEMKTLTEINSFKRKIKK